MQLKKETETIPISTRITKPMLKGIQIVLKVNSHLNTADYLRDLVRRDLEVRKIKMED